LLPPLPVPVSQVLRHNLSSVQRGPGTNPPPHAPSTTDKVLWVDNLVSPFGLLPADQPDSVCICPSVFGQSSAVGNRWICRPLLFSKLLQAFDISSDWAKYIPVVSPGNYSLSPVTHTVPSKILIPFARALLDEDVSQLARGELLEASPSPVSSITNSAQEILATEAGILGEEDVPTLEVKGDGRQ
jgi:hypothetical protein